MFKNIDIFFLNFDIRFIVHSFIKEIKQKNRINYMRNVKEIRNLYS